MGMIQRIQEVQRPDDLHRGITPDLCQAVMAWQIQMDMTVYIGMMDSI